MPLPAGPPPPDPRVGSPVPPARAVPPPARNRYVDLVRLVAILTVLFGHWLASIVVVDDGQPQGRTALAEIGYMRWLTLALQVMPMFFLAGGYAAAASWPSWRARGGHWAGWTHSRFVRLLRPTSWFVGIVAAVAGAAALLGTPPRVLAQAGWGVALQLWFLPVYLLLLVLAVPMITAWGRVRWKLLGAMVAVVAVVDVLVRGLGIGAAGWLSYLVVPAAGLVLGVAWHAGALAGRAAAVGMLVGGVGALVVLISAFDYPPWMVGIPGEPPANTAPPNLALVAYATAQIGLVLLLEGPGRRLLERPRTWAVVVRGSAVIMTMYLWHMVPVLVVAALLVVTGLPTGPTPGSAAWWAARIPWIGLLALILAGIVRLVARFERPGPPRLALRGWIPSGLLLVCAGLTGSALSRLAVGGFAPAGQLAIGVLVTYAAGMAALWLAAARAPSGRAPSERAPSARG